ncbi:MAG: hypothetical protein KDA28_00825, partial [Phycisphaerales bacterium]|nr:hypothetical protein [Phycisphaerales bacterium]
MPALTRLVLLLLVAACPAVAQDHHLVVPHARVFTTPGAASVEMPSVETIVKIRDQVATTTLRVTLKNT